MVPYLVIVQHHVAIGSVYLLNGHLNSLSLINTELFYGVLYYTNS